MHLTSRRERAGWGTRTALLACAAVSLLLGACGGEPLDDTGPTGGATISLEDCVLLSPDRRSSLDALCGRLRVYEDRFAGAGRAIDLNIAVVPAVTRNPQPDPLFFLAGGPGQAATEAYPSAAFAFERVHEDRDVVLLDQRGTGDSNPLDCERSADEDVSTSDEAALKAWVETCVESLSQHANLRLYTTAIAMDDLDDVRVALGYDRINLYGGSYGTRAALAYLRQHPEHVRTVILDSVVPPDLALGTTIARDAQHALDLFFDRCAASQDCSQADQHRVAARPRHGPRRRLRHRDRLAGGPAPDRPPARDPRALPAPHVP